MNRNYSELKTLTSFEDRVRYLQLNSNVMNEEQAMNRWLKQKFYNSEEWKRIRREIIIRDNGLDLGLEGCEITSNRVYIHHINLITPDDIKNRNNNVFDPENLISVSHSTHNMIHYGQDIKNKYKKPPKRKKGDTTPWKED